ncbi:Ig-like V-type domain-containing protein FAM187A [Frankliniella fusca]|uniref:Ig-like V-type domain-containing protein FAM187A n=1 Tax=Frankliniella fusca TaxID=407009 RepID=A0AAE1HTG4_9NEOP|nr:Ig-like V-type domain-containing protein FAM187A [Frankliniella fusca]
MSPLNLHLPSNRNHNKMLSRIFVVIIVAVIAAPQKFTFGFEHYLGCDNHTESNCFLNKKFERGWPNKTNMEQLEQQNKTLEQLENFEFKNLKRKWDTLTNENKASDFAAAFPEAWLQPARWRNTTFNSSLNKNELMMKISALIEKHEKQSKLPGRLMVTRMPMNRLLALQPVAKTFDIGEKVQNIKKTVQNGQSTNTSTEDDGYYPGGNSTVRRKLFEEWKTFYECLQKNVNVTPKVHYAFQGETIKLNCMTCLRPGGQAKIKWKIATSRTKNIEKEIDSTEKRSAFHENRRIVIKDNGLSLNIFAIDENDAGNYSCTQSKTLLTVHLLQVARETENITKVWSVNFKGKPHPTPNITLPNFGLIAFTNWRNWTECSRCGRVGKRFRIGVCTVGAINNSQNAPEVLTLFKEGVPCRSGLLPKPIRDHPNIISRKSEVMEAFCKEPCPEIKKFVIRNEKGQIVEEADNANGIYSTLQKLPKLPPPVKRKILFLEQWDTAHIQCPGSLLSDVPTRWFVNGQPIYAKGDRIYVTPSHNLVVEDLGLSDSTLYRY